MMTSVDCTVMKAASPLFNRRRHRSTMFDNAVKCTCRRPYCIAFAYVYLIRGPDRPFLPSRSRNGGPLSRRLAQARGVVQPGWLRPLSRTTAIALRISMRAPADGTFLRDLAQHRDLGRGVPDVLIPGSAAI
jgi:hypothetical protein